MEERFIGNAYMYEYQEKKELLKDPSIATRPQEYTKKFYHRARKYDDVTKMQYLDINLWMVGDILLKADRMSMANSLELRVPFLDKEVFNVARTIPTRLRVNKHNTKYALRQSAMRHMPEDSAQKEKLGFPVPTRVWLKDEKYYNIVKKEFTSPTAQKFFNIDVLTQWLDTHFEGKADTSRQVWTVYVFLLWYKMYFGEVDNQEITDEAVAEVQQAIDSVEETSTNIGEMINTDEFDAFFGMAGEASEENTESAESTENTEIKEKTESSSEN